MLVMALGAKDQVFSPEVLNDKARDRQQIHSQKPGNVHNQPVLRQNGETGHLYSEVTLVHNFIVG